MLNIKNDFHIDTLLAILPFITMIDNGLCGEDSRDLMRIIDYADILEHTKITEGLFIGEDAIFEGFKKNNFGGPTTPNKYYTKRISISFYKFKTRVSIQAFTVKDNGWEANDFVFIKTLFDLALLTKENPLKLK